MGKSYRPYYPDEELLLPPSLRDWLPEDHLCYFVSDVVDNLGVCPRNARRKFDGSTFRDPIVDEPICRRFKKAAYGGKNRAESTPEVHRRSLGTFRRAVSARLRSAYSYAYS